MTLSEEEQLAIYNKATGRYTEQIEKVSKILGESLVTAAISSKINHPAGESSEMENFRTAKKLATEIGERIGQEIIDEVQKREAGNPE